MNVFTGKHMIIAVVMAPLLAVGSYYAVGHLWGEKPHVAREGQSYPLAEKPNCRYGSGRCGLKNKDFELELTVTERGAEQLVLNLVSELPLEGVMIALARPGETEPEPVAMASADPTGLVWSTEIANPSPAVDRLQLVAAAQHSYWFGDVSTAFTSPQ